MTDIISAIDQATGCQQCGKPLDLSVSDDFCGEGCQQAWHAGRVGAPLDHWLGVESLATRPTIGTLTLAAPRIASGDRMTVQFLDRPTETYRYDGARWVRIDTVENAHVEDPLDGVLGSHARHEGIRAVSEQAIAHAFGLPSELLGTNLPTSVRVMRGRVQW